MALDNIIHQLEYYRDSGQEMVEDVAKDITKDPMHTLRNMDEAYFVIALGDVANGCLSGIQSHKEAGWPDGKVVKEMIGTLTNEVIAQSKPYGLSTSQTRNLMDRAVCSATARILGVFRLG